ncbi:NAD(P)-binding dehydrogenase [Leisingera methylohalidivorans DSM 14336]|uniref:NAD(P)-binding dehydrogenase n=2 Tax=Leisingera methylohalidivorans TaxID=133924 RepID=V9VRW4_9RHOB|nr:NAD(P)-binding dehydrogenase [Leisingera methylohalidivorans DSM 14336]
MVVAVDKARLFGVPLPQALCPQSVSTEFETPEGHLGFDISASLPRIGLLVRYSGYLVLPELDLRR